MSVYIVTDSDAWDVCTVVADQMTNALLFLSMMSIYSRCVTHPYIVSMFSGHTTTSLWIFIQKNEFATK